MATFTITDSKNIDELTGKTGGDIYNINGGTLTIDQHSRFGLNNANTSATAATSMGNITISATLGGTVNIDARNVKMLQFTGGSGTVPAANSIVTTQGGGSGKLIGIYGSGLTTAPLAVGAAVPSTGYILFKQWNGLPMNTGAITLSGVTATNAYYGKVGFLEIFGDEASTVTANRLGSFNVYGDWYVLGTTTGVNNQTLQVPNNGTNKYIAGVWIEQTAGLKDYEFYPNAGTATTIGTDAYRGKVVWITATGLVQIGYNGTANMGYVPPSGLQVVVPNVFLCNCTTAARNAEVIPNATVATRYDFTTTGGGVVNIDKANIAWYPSFSQAYSVQLTNCQAIDQILVSELATPTNWNNVGVGLKPTTALLTNPLSLSLCFAGGTITNYTGARVSHAASGAYTDTMADIDGFTFTNYKPMALTIRGNVSTGSLQMTRGNNCNFINPKIVQGRMLLTTCENINITDAQYCDVISGTTGTTYASSFVDLASNCNNITISGLTLPVTNTQPYAQLVGITAAGCKNIKIRNIGTLASPLNLGSTNATGYVAVLSTGAAANNVKVQRVYVSNTRSGFSSGDNSSKNVLIENSAGDYADTYTGLTTYANLNALHRAVGNSFTTGQAASVYGTHFVDTFYSTTGGRILILMNEPSAETTNQVTLANGANFTSAGSLYMPTIGMSVTFEMPYYALGHTQYSNTALVMNGGTATNYNYNFSIDKNDGAGWSAMTTANYTPTTLGTALNAVGVFDASKGHKLKLKVTTTVTNTTAIANLYLTTISTVTAQGYQYPLDTVTLTLNGLVSGSDIVILNAGTEVERVNVDANPSTSYNYVYDTTGNIDIVVYKRGYIPFSIRNYSLSASNASLPIAQIADRNYIE
jgi:hypothetical protein